MTNNNDKGTRGELLVQNFFDSQLSRLFSFPHAKTKANAQVADLFLWLNWRVLLVEVKTRDKSKVSIDSWARSRIQEGVDQICTNHERCNRGEEIFIRNDSYHVRFSNEGIDNYHGLILLLFDDDCNYPPTEAVSDIYEKSLPIQVLTWKNMIAMTSEIDTAQDFYYYLSERYRYIKDHDIPIGCELDVLGYYKMNGNRFPKEMVDFKSGNYWDNYRTTMADAIIRRAAHNQQSTFINALEDHFKEPRKLHEGLPVGLYFAWEIGTISRRERAYLGDKIDEIQSKFIQGSVEQCFSIRNPSTNNYLVFLFSVANKKDIHSRLEEVIRLRLIKEIHQQNFSNGAYGFGFQVSETSPVRILGLVSGIVLGAGIIEQSTQDELNRAIKSWGRKPGDPMQILEFPPE